MNKEFYDKYSKDLECSSCITLTRCMNEDRPLCTRGYIKFQEDTAIIMQKQITEKEKLIEEQKIRIRALNEENFLLKDDVQMSIKIQNKHDIEKNQTAIAELEKVKESILKIDKTEIKTLENGWSVLYVDEAEVITVIDQQIKSLKGEK